jgi:hypothetical protein
MKATITFNLDDTEDRMAHMRCVNSLNMALFIWELKHNFWRKWKHDETDFNLDSYKEALAELLEEHNVNIETLLE